MKFNIQVTDLPSPTTYDVGQKIGKILHEDVLEHLNIAKNVEIIRCLISITTDDSKSYHLVVVNCSIFSHFFWVNESMNSIGSTFHCINPDLIAEAKDFLSILATTTPSSS